MSASKLRTIHVIIIGTFACLVVIAGLYFLVIKNRYKEIGDLNTRLAAAEQTWAQKARAEDDLLAAKEENARITSMYEKYMVKKMPVISMTDRAQGMIALWHEQAETLGPLLKSWPGKTGVRLESDMQVPAAPVDPNAIDTTLIRIPIGNIQVRGDFRTLLSHIRSWNNFNRLVQIEPASLEGNSPAMTAQYALTVYLFPQGQPGPTVAMAGGGGGAGGVMGGMPAGPGISPIGPGAAPGGAPTGPGAPPPPERPR